MKNNSIIKILLLGVGLAMGLILIAKLYYERVYDNFMDDPQRVYIVQADYTSSEGKETGYSQTPGAIAPGIKAYCAAVEFATRTTGISSNIALKVLSKEGVLSQGQYVCKNIIVADSSFFDIFTRKITGNNPREGLNIKNHIYISRSFAQTISKENPDNLIGNMLSPVHLGDGELKFIIDGIYEDFPENSSYNSVDVIMSMPTMGIFTWDGSNNWVGNDRYQSFVKLTPGQKATDVDEGIAQMCEKNLPHEELKKAGVKINYHIEPLETYNIKSSDKAQMCINIIILAVLVLSASLLNYVLIAISAMVHKAKMVAVRKCYGASEYHIYKMVFTETLIHILISLALGAFIILAFQKQIEELIGASIGSLFTLESLAILAGICIIVFILCGLLPATNYAKIPVASAFRRYKESSRKWKLILLFLQFAASSVLVCLLTVVMLQYNTMINGDTGYSYKNTAVTYLGSAYANKKESIKAEISKLSFVEKVAVSATIPIMGQSGNNIMLPNDDKEYFNIADMYHAGRGYIDLMEIKIIDGRNFNEDAMASNEVLVSRSFVTKMEQMAGWKDGAVGKSILVTEHSQSPTAYFTICGVYEDYLIGSFEGQDDRPSVQFYAPEGSDIYPHLNWMYIKLKEVTPDNLAAIEKIILNANPTSENKVMALSNEIVLLYKESNRFKNTVMIAGIIVLIITLIGLLGYSQDEINRRRSEIAVRKINGATVPELIKLFLNNVIKLALPAIIIGSVIAYYAADSWLELFTKKITLSWYIFAAPALIILLIISAIVAIKTYSAANANPVHNLKSE